MFHMFHMFSFTFLCKFLCICNFGIFIWIFMKFSSKCRTKKLEMIYTILGSFSLFLNWEGADIQPQIRPKKILVVLIQENGICMYGKPRNVHEIVLT